MEQSLGLHTVFKEQSKIIEMIALENLPLSHILAELIRTIDLLMPEMNSSILLYDAQTNTLGNGIGPKLPQSYLEALDGLKVGPNVGSCGSAVYNRETIIVADTRTDPRWKNFQELCIQYDIKSCWSKPIISSSNEVLGTLAFYYNEIKEPTIEERELIDTFTNLAGLIISKKRTEETLYLSNRVVENSPVILMRWKAEEGWPLEYVSNNVNRLGYTPQEFLSGDIVFASIIHPDDLTRVGEEVTYYSEHWIDDFTQEYRIFTKDRHIRWIDDRTVIKRNKKGVITHYQGTILDITERKEAEVTIKFLADNDPLTHLPNRRVFLERLNVNISKAKLENTKVAVLFLDLDNFKDVNDLMGHLYGDQLLMVVSELLKKCVPDNGMVSRVSGDEFAFILWNVDGMQQVTEFTQCLLASFQSPIIVEEKEFQITASIGACLYPDHGDDPELLIAKADHAMYNAKKSGKNNFQLFTTELYDSILLKKQLEQEMKFALSGNQFTLCYQPIIDIHSGELSSVEALIRWNHPTRGLISPIHFIPLAEETGLIYAIDEWVLENACRQNAIWKEKGYQPLTMSINLSARQFYNKELVHNVEKLLSELDLPPEFLTLEMTEGTLMQHTSDTVQVLTNLKKIGVKTSLDDFGTGYSSLSYLKNLPITNLKIDRSFISDLFLDRRNGPIVEAIFTLASHLDLTIIAEGVETVEQLEFLKKTNCKFAQGGFISSPVTAEEMEAILK
ncbi:EAL domain-containing protein [Evansella tamaricis]|uniref:EAL domain-containing protein n=1 Tax=Evansella tamaricis TaxID=2069301 RepID=A0ABS6JCX8_9BACI|nr:EAL domain-containing protein [Evansella tamaricis]MBU9711529.1 EAL domain-containing protein [Evansella tamaricis]